jgi:uncharacterized membrane protein YdbT with pleckstrin-like domain
MAKADVDSVYPASETVIYRANPAMFRNHPIWFTLSVLTVPLLVGGVVLFVWWLQCMATTLTVTNRRVSLRKGIVSKCLNDVFHNDIRNVRVSQTPLQRLLKVGYIGISTAAQAGIEIEVNGIPDPLSVKAIIDRYR